MSSLGEVAKLWAAGQREQAFELLCRVWAQTQDLALAELCEQLSEQLVRERRRSLSELSPAEQHAVLMNAAKAGDRVAVHALLPWLLSVARPGARQRIALLEPPDPVLLRNLMVWLHRRGELNTLAEYLADHRSFWLDQHNLWLSRESSQKSSYWREAHRRFIRGPRPRAMTPAESAEVAGLAASLASERTPAQAKIEALLDAVRERPDDDTPRALLADYLLSLDEDDPRGQLINLQLCAAAGRLPDAACELERELLDLHGFRRLGPLARDCVPSSARFRRGFLASVELRSDLRWQPGFAAPGHPIWATVEQLVGGTWAVVGQPIMRSLRSLDCDPDCARSLLAGQARPRIEALSLTLPPTPATAPQLLQPPPDPGRVLTIAREIFASLAAVPNLCHLRLRDGIRAEVEDCQWLWQGPRARLESVRLRLVAGASPLWRWAEQLRSDRSQLQLRIDHGHLCFTLMPTDGHRTVRVQHTLPAWRVVPERTDLLAFLGRMLAPSLGVGKIRRVELLDGLVDVQGLCEVLQQAGVDVGIIEVVAAKSC